jgi:S-(hydroxymethyl)glutathione dehydrogenase / alcohol dehydrogenase
MRAFVIDAPNSYRIRDDVETVALGPHDVRVRLAAAGICRTDHSALNGKWPTGLPCVNGHEGAGIITEVGAAVPDREIGQHVILGPPSCGRCYYCVRELTIFCIDNDRSGSKPRFQLADGTPLYAHVGRGTWAEELVVHARAAVVIPDSVPLDVASVIGCAVMTGVGQVINVARPEPGSSAILFGGGGVGACAIMGARLAGCGIIVAVEPATAKHAALKRFGATHVVLPDQVGEAKADLTAGRGFDYAFENVGRLESLRAAWDAARPGGTVVVTGLGGTGSRIDFNMNELSFFARHLIGNVGGGVVPARDFPRYCELYELGKLDLDSLITARISLDQIPDALEALDNDPGVMRQVIQFK